jgi:hypothetical protein
LPRRVTVNLDMGKTAAPQIVSLIGNDMPWRRNMDMAGGA